MQKLVFRNANGIELDLTSDPFGITEWEGFSADELNIQSQQVPFQDGGVYLDALLGERELAVTVAMNDQNNLETRYRLRREMISKLNPKLGEGVLIYTNDFLSKQIHVIPQLPVFENHNSNDSGTPKASCVFTACNPYWEDLEETTVELPTSTPIENNGDVPCQIKAVLNAGASNPVLFNKANNKEIGLSGVFDFDVEVNTNSGEKSIKTVELGMKWISGGNFFSCCFGQGKLIFVGTVSVCIDLFSGKRYTLNITGKDINKIKYINNTFFALSFTYIYRSIDGINWTRSVGAELRDIRDIVYAKNQYVIVTSGGFIRTSPDGIIWTTQTSGNNFNGIAFANDMFVVVGTMGTVLTSPDGVNWTSRTSGTNYELREITFANNMFVAVGELGTIITSVDGISWTTQTPPSSILNYYGVGEAKGEIFALGNGGRFATSVDGTNWTLNTIGESINLRDIMLVYNKYYICGEKGSIFTSEDKSTWTQIQTVYQDDFLDTVYAEGVFIACGSTGLYTSEDGENWVKRITGTRITSVTYGNGKYIAVSNGGKVYSSTDGVNWNYITLSNTQNYNRIRYVNNIFIIAGNYGTIITSADGETWTERTSGTTQMLSGVAYGNGIYVVAGRECSVVSEDLANWVSYTHPSPFISNALAFGNGVFISAGGAGIYTRWVSIDGQIWVSQDSSGQEICDVEYLNNTFIFVCSNNTQYVEMSKDGMNWNKINAQTAFGLRGISYGKGKYVFVGNNGLIYNTYIAGFQNNISFLTPESDMTFNLEQGENEIVYLTDGNTQATLSYRQKYIGV